ncbi:hypothetical protein BDB00DRAFT_753377 [Zychaea mexicana]|uniref:uncharacterized protein n=1 Tax=Zychaea mexicana TaxID=64656 RepID=UPI0022FDB2A8|nr:uncharacterized protein BDB00DRAFT_753377 [Zychaea mexicana]KAI9499219.1 hypothetical protein BDB00DRAFT_753377 [Zychaea mexicana]
MPPKKKKLKTSLKNVLNLAEAHKREKYKQQSHQARIAQTKQKQKTHPKHGRKPKFTSTDRVLLIGEGNFSFAKSIAEHYMASNPGNIIATCYDSEQMLYEKYADEAKSNVATLKELGVTVLFEIDGTKLRKYKDLRKNRYTKIIFNFPHAGAGIKDQDHNIRANQKLLNEFFASAVPLLSKEGETSREMHVTIKTCKPYDLWDIRTLAKTTGKAIKTTFPFHPDIYPGYEHRRTLGFKEGVSKGENAEIIKADPKTFVVVRKSAMEAEKERSKQGAIKRKKDLQRQALLGKKKRKHLFNPKAESSDDDDDNDDDDDDEE